MSIELFKRARNEKLYLTDGFEFGRTVPVRDELGNAYTGFVKTTVGEHKVSGNNKIIHNLLMSGKEITHDEYESKNLGHEHSWRMAWLKNSKTTRKVTYCTLCGELKKD
jgi:hypothetical protein